MFDVIDIQPMPYWIDRIMTSGILILKRIKKMNEWMMHLYSAFIVYCCTHKVLYNHVWGGVSPQPPPVCSIHLDDTMAATGQRHQCAHHTSYRRRGERVIEPIKRMLSPHTSYRRRGERVIETIKCMLSPHTSYRWRGERVIEPIKCMLSPHTGYR